MLGDYLKLHLIVVLAGFTSILGDVITLDAAALVFWRTLIAALALAVLVRRTPQAEPSLSFRERALLFGNGLLIGLHWYLFFLSVKISNPSVCMIGMATVAFWTAVLEPAISRRRGPSLYELGLGLVMLGAIAFAAGGDGFRFGGGLLVAVASALVATVFSIFNGMFSRRHHHYLISVHGISGACFFNGVLLLTTAHLASPDAPVEWVPPAADVPWILILALVCTVFAYTLYVELLKRVSVFSVNLAFNLEPVYGVVLAALILKDYEELNARFYFGAGVIFVAVVSYPFVQRTRARRAARRRGDGAEIEVR